ncbi:MAG: sensor histidine kinase, partial [Bacteroidales bacterium]
IFLIDHDILKQNHFDLSNFENNGVNLLCDFPGMGIWCSNTKAAYLLKNKDFYKLSVSEAIQPINIIYMFKNPALLLGSSNSRICTFENLKFNADSKVIEYSKKLTYNIFTKKIINDLTGNIVTLFDQNKILITNKYKPSLSSEYTAISERINNVYYNAKNELVINAKKNYLYKKNKLESYPQLSRFDGTVISDHLVLDDSTELFNIDGDSLFIMRNYRLYNLTDAFDIPVDKQIKSVFYTAPTLYLVTLSEIYLCQNPCKIILGHEVSLEPLNLSFNNIKDFLIHNDTLFIASDDGLTVIPEEAISESRPNPPIAYLQSITVNDKTLPFTANELKLSGKNYIKLSFGCISYSSSPVSFSYMLVGAENKWTNGSGSKINLVYQNLPKGHYIFKLRVRKSNSSWSKPLQLSITIRPTLFEYPAFWIFIALMVAGLIFLITFRLRIQKMKKAEVDHQLIVMEQKALQSMMNPHFIFNSLGSIQNYLLKNKGSEAVIYLSQFARLIRQNLNAINTPMIALDEEIDRLRNYIDLENKRLENKFEYSIEIDELLEEDRIYIPSMIIQPIAENSIWHGLATMEAIGIIKIRFRSHTSKSLRVIVEDNGIGLKKSLEYSAKSSQHQHLGMQIIKKRLHLLSKKYRTELGIYYSESSPGQSSPGAVVEIILPFVLSNEDF